MKRLFPCARFQTKLDVCAPNMGTVSRARRRADRQFRFRIRQRRVIAQMFNQI